MGLEATCEVRLGGRAVAGKARLEAAELLFRGGDLRLRIPFAEVRSAVARGGALELTFAGKRASFALGPAAEKWAFKIRNPRGLLDKLGVKPGLRVSVAGLHDQALLRQLRERAPDLSEGKLRMRSDLIFAGFASKTELARLARVRAALTPAGAVWAVWVKGQRTLTEDDVRAAALAAGLVDIKVVSVSETLSGLKLVIPVSRRKG